MRTIPPDSRIAADRPATSLVMRISTTPPREPDHGLAPIASTQAYLVCMAAGGIPGPDQRAAWDEFYRSFAPDVRREARGRGRAATLAADAEQDIWLRVVERLGSFRIDASLGSFPGWLRAVARRRMADRRRVAARRPFPTTWDEPPVHLAGAGMDPADACERAEERARLGGLLERLRAEVSALNYRILHLRSLEERPVSEVGRLVGRSPAQVRARHHRMLERLRRLAGAAGPEKGPEKSRSARNAGRTRDVLVG